MIAVVLAGGAPDAVSALQPGAPNKAFVRVAGTALVQRAIAGLRGAPEIARVIAVAPPAVHDSPELMGADERRSDGVKVRESLRNGLAGLPPDELVLIAASDLPVLTGDAAGDFVRRALKLDADVGYGCVERSVHLARYPDVPHTWARLREGTFCGGGLIVVKPRVLPALEGFLDRLAHARKSPFALASLFGYRTLLAFALRRLRMGQAEARASALLGAPVRAIVSPYPQTAVNVDRASDVALAELLLQAETSAAAL